MKSDESGVGGFFEDLPVLAFVLAGTAILLMSTTWSCEHLASQHAYDELRKRAVSFVERICAELRGSRENEIVPSLSSIEKLNYSRLAGEELNGRQYALAILQLYPLVRWVVEHSGPEPSRSEVAAATALLNALNEEGVTVIIEVRAIVW
ncbi:MAG: hypothetical protein ACUVT7_06635 [Thermoplasmata archaeon]